MCITNISLKQYFYLALTSGGFASAMLVRKDPIASDKHVP